MRITTRELLDEICPICTQDKLRTLLCEKCPVHEYMERIEEVKPQDLNYTVPKCKHAGELVQCNGADGCHTCQYFI